MQLYRVELQVAATGYIRAISEEEARDLVIELRDEVLEIPDGDWGVEISGRRFDDPALPAVSLSPAMTILGPWDVFDIELEELEEEEEE